VEPTCDEKGYTIYTCSCGHSYQADPVFVLGHNYSEWKNTVIPTSEREGVREKTCSRCGDKITDTLPKLPPEEHTHSYETKVVPPTCTSKGYTTYTCSCGHTREGDYVSVLDHDFTEWKVTVAATTSSTGLKERTCKSCGRRVELEIPKLEATGHTHSYTGTWKAPTCTEDGVTVFTCSCGDTYKGTDWQRPLGHDYTEWVVTKEPTTTACGDKQRSCKRCGLVEKDIVSPLDPSTGEKYESYIDPRIVYGDLMPGYYQYIEGNIIVQDRRSWGEAPSLYIESNGDLRVVYFQKDGTKITKTVTPKADQTQSVAIKNNGTFVVTDWHGFG